MFRTRKRSLQHIVHVANCGVAVQKKDVPQDQNATLGGHRKALYAVDENGQYSVVPTTGWEVEETVTSLAVEQYNELTNDALTRAKQGLTAPLEYHTFAKRLNVATLAQATGLFQWQVKRHCKPAVFKKLSESVLSRYADALGITVTALQQLPQE